MDITPIVDIGAVFGSDPIPEGFTRVSTTCYGRVRSPPCIYIYILRATIVLSIVFSLALSHTRLLASHTHRKQI